MAILEGATMIKVTWVDATLYAGWHSDWETEPLVNESVGFLIEENESAVVIALSKNRYKIGDYLVIPRSSIVEQVYIQEAQQ